MSNWRNINYAKEFEAIFTLLADLRWDAKKAGNQAMIHKVDKLVAMIIEVDESIV